MLTTALCSQLDPETVAREVLERVLVDEAPAGLPCFDADGRPPEFRCLGTTTLAAGGHRTVKFRQLYHDVPVFGSLITVELDRRNRPLSLNAAFGQPVNVDPVARLAPAAAISRAAELTDPPVVADSVPQLVCYFDETARRWRLAYSIREVRVRAELDDAVDLQSFDCFVDAHFGDLIATLPAASRLLEESRDALGQVRTIRCRDIGGGTRLLIDDELNVWTYDFEYRNVDRNRRSLPGYLVRRSAAAEWSPEAVGAHANACAAAQFLRDTAGRRSLDGRGQAIILSIRCGSPAGDREWRNAGWLGRQAVFGQRRDNGAWISYADDLDVVAHEILHGVNVASARLGQAGESGALSESYADIFAVLVANRDEPDLGRWRWEIGADADQGETRLRDLADPARHGQPAHMDDYQSRPLTAAGDYGGVHVNSGIHNHAAYRILSAKDPQGAGLFTLDVVARLFLLALTEHLSRTSRFSNSRQAIEVVAESVLAGDPRLATQLAAVADAFDAVGIVRLGPSG